MTVKIGVFGTSWWADTMYLPPLAAHPDCEVVAVCGRRPDPAAAFAEQWNVPKWFVDPTEMLETVELDGVVIATSNDAHHDLALAAIERGLHVLCEKPLARTVAEAKAMTAAASEAGVITMLPFTYHHMPVNQWVKRLIDDGYIGRPLHANIRYYTDFGFDDAYSWRFDKELAGSGIIGDLGAHWVHLSRWLLNSTETVVSAMSSTFVERGPRPDGSAYEPCEDSVVMNIRYASGAYASLQTSAVCWSGTPFGQTHHLEVHGTEGALHAFCDWDTVQEVRGVKKGDSQPAQIIPIPDEVWNGVRRDTVHNTYRDVFRTTDTMTRAWVSAIRDGAQVAPDFDEGLAVQRVLDAAVESSAGEGTPIRL